MWAAAGRGPEGSASCVWTGWGCQAEGHVYPGLRSHHLPSLGPSLLWKGNSRTQPQKVFTANPASKCVAGSVGLCWLSLNYSEGSGDHGRGSL